MRTHPRTKCAVNGSNLTFAGSPSTLSRVIAGTDQLPVRPRMPDQAAVSLLDPRAPLTPHISRLRARAGPAVAEAEQQEAVFRAALEVELRAIAGLAELPLSVQALAHLAAGAMGHYQLQCWVGRGHYGRWAEADLDSELAMDTGVQDARRVTRGERAERSLRNAAGLAIVARDLLAGARVAAREARVTHGSSATQGLFARLGVGGPGSEETASNVVDSGGEPWAVKIVVDGEAEACLDRVPVLTPGVGSVGAPPPEIHSTPNPFAPHLATRHPAPVRQPLHALSLLPQEPGRWLQKPGTAGLPTDWYWVAG